MKNIKIFGSGCGKCKATYNNVLAALKETGTEAIVQKIEDIEEMMKYNVLSTPALMIDEEVKIKGRIANINEVKTFLIL